MPNINVTERVYEKIQAVKDEKGSKTLSDAVNILIERNEALEKFFKSLNFY